MSKIERKIGDFWHPLDQACRDRSARPDQFRLANRYYRLHQPDSARGFVDINADSDGYQLINLTAYSAKYTGFQWLSQIRADGPTAYPD
jgi:hypothetical protein